MICDKCRNVEKTYVSDGYGNVSIHWRCSKRYISLYHQMIYSDQFLSEVHRGYQHIRDDIIFQILPKNKDLKDIQKVEVLFRREPKECGDFSEHTKPLNKYFHATKDL